MRDLSIAATQKLAWVRLSMMREKWRAFMYTSYFAVADVPPANVFAVSCSMHAQSHAAPMA